MDPGASWNYGRMALHAVAVFSLGSDIDALVAPGCDIECVDRENATALYYALNYGNPSAYFALIQNGAKMERDNTDDRLLMNAILCKAGQPLSKWYFVESDYDTIVRHLLCRYVPLGSYLYIYTSS
jgi:ankyrin repeat protein